MQQAEDFRQEVADLAALAEPLDAAALGTRTQFMGWSIEDVIGHLHMFDAAALLALDDEAAFAAMMKPVSAMLRDGKPLIASQGPWLDGLCGPALVEKWHSTARTVADQYARADPKRRLIWIGPSMSARSAISARQMETWAHAQAIYDVLGRVRVNHDRIRNIVHMGVNTFGWTFSNRSMAVPDPAPYVRLTAPSGAEWTWNAPQEDNVVAGSAEAFAQVVTQVRNVADTDISCVGQTAESWMAMAQCFAGKPVDPPVRGARTMAST